MKIPLHISINKAIQLLLLFLFVLNLSDGLFSPLLAVYIEDFIVGATLSTVGFAIAIYSISKSIIQLPLARRIDLMKGERDVFYVMSAGVLIGIIVPLFLIIIEQVWHLYLLLALAGVGGACLMSAYYSIFAHHVDKNNIGFEWSLFSVGGLTFSAAIGAALGGMVAEAFGFRILFFTSALLNVVASLILFWLYPHLRGIRNNIQTPKK